MIDPADVNEPAECEKCGGYVNAHEPTCETLLDFPEVPSDYDERPTVADFREFCRQATLALRFGPGA